MFVKMWPKAVLGAMMFLLILQSNTSHGQGTTSSSSSSSSSMSSSSVTTSSTAMSSSATTSSTAMSSSSVTTSSTSMSSTTVTVTVTSTVTPNEISPTSVMAMVISSSVPFVEWADWKTEEPTDCDEKCCNTGGPVIKQIRNCTVHQPRCNFTECMYYGPTERDISCYTACSHCMPGKGHILAGPGVIPVTAALLISLIITRA